MALRAILTGPMLRVSVLVGSSAVWSSMALAGGLSHQQGVTGMGTAYAGASATASDPVTLFYNPAGMTNLQDGHIMSVSASHLSLKNSFRDSGSTSATGAAMSGNDGGNFGTQANIPNLYYIHHSGAWAVGLGYSVPYAMKISYDPTWKGRFQFTNGQFVVQEVAPAASYRLNEQLSFGASLGYQSLALELNSKLNNFNICYQGAKAKGAPDATAKAACASQVGVEGDSKIKGKSTGYVFGFGVLYKPTNTLNVGFNFRTASKHKVTGTAEYQNTAFAATSGILTNSDVHGDSVMPGQAALAVSHTHDALTLSADVTYTGWSTLKSLAYDFDDNTPTKVTELNWRNSIRAGVGAAYKVTAQIPVRVGFAFDQSPTPDAEHRVPSLPDADRKVFGLGAGYEVDNYKINFGMSQVMVSNSGTDTTSSTGERLMGEYRNGNFWSAGLQFDYVL